MKILLKVLKYALIITPAMIVLIVILRVFSSGDPPESKLIINTHSFETAYKKLGNDFVMYKINLRNPFAVGDVFCVVDTFYLESSQDLQLSFRGKKNRFGEIRDYLNIASDNYAGLLKLYLRATTRALTDIPGGIQEETLFTEIFETSAQYLFETERYEYIRVNFSGIEADTKTKLELFVFDNLREFAPDDLDNSGYIARITVLDINMPRERVKIERYKILK